MQTATVTPQGSRAGAVIVLSSAQGRNPDGTRIEGLTDRSHGYHEPMTQPEDSQRQDRQPDKDGPRVLLVDDAASIRNALRGVLEDAGIEVVGGPRRG